MSPEPVAALASASLRHLFGRLHAVEAAVRCAVAVRRAQDGPDGDDRFRGLYITDQDVDRLLEIRPRPAPRTPAVAALRARAEADADAAERAGADLRLRRLTAAFGLDGDEEEILLVALAPDLDSRFERLYSYLHDDVTRRRPSCALALELVGLPATDRARLLPARPLVAGGLLAVEQADVPFLSRPLRVPDRVAAHLLGDDDPDPVLAPLLTTVADVDVDGADTLVQSMRRGQELFYVRDRPRTAGLALAGRMAAVAGVGTVVVDLERVDAADDIKALAAAAAREARLRSAVLVVSPIDVLARRGAAGVRAFADAPGPVMLLGSRPWDPAWSRRPPVLADAPTLDGRQRREGWTRALNGETPLDFDPAAVMAQFDLAPEQVQAAAAVATLRAKAGQRKISADDLMTGARAQNAAGLERLARRIEPHCCWDDLVLPGHVLQQLKELVARVRLRAMVFGEWGVARRSTRGHGVTALLAGPSGTGKTMSAGVVAFELGLDLYVIDLSTVVDKYVGETEKNLDRIFAEADRVNGVLFFDEADAIFGKRSEVKDSRDRWANMEVSYLLQRMEQFDGIVLLGTNLRSNVDEAFTRRLDAVVEFPLPDEPGRRRLWEANLGPGIPRNSDVDLEFLARSFKLSGGNIASIALTAAFLAAESGEPLAMADLIRATHREYRKLGRLCVESEFARYYPLVAAAQSP